MVKYLSFYISHAVHVLLWIKYGFMTFVNHILHPYFFETGWVVEVELERLLHQRRHASLVCITVTGQWDWDIWPVETWLFHLSNYTSGGRGGVDDSQSVNHWIDSSTVNLSSCRSPPHAIIFHHDAHSTSSTSLCFFNHLSWHLWHTVCANTHTHTHHPLNQSHYEVQLIGS